MNLFLRPGCFMNESDGRIRAVVGEKIRDDLRKTRTGKKDADGRPMRTEGPERFLFGHRRGPSSGSSKNDRLRERGFCQFGSEDRGCRNKGRHPRNDFIFYAQPVKSFYLFGGGAINGGIPRVKTRDINSFLLCVDVVCFLLVQIKMRRINDRSVNPAMNQHLFAY